MAFKRVTYAKSLHEPPLIVRQAAGTRVGLNMAKLLVAEDNEMNCDMQSRSFKMDNLRDTNLAWD